MKDVSTIRLDPTDLNSMITLMDTYGDSNTLYPGTNENGETVHISIFHEKIVVVTFQTNRWIRKNVYWRDGTREELFEGRDDISTSPAHIHQ